MTRLVTLGSAALAFLAGATTLLAQQNPAPAEPAPKLWVASYFVVLLGVVLGAMLFLRPGTREEPKV